MRKVLALTTVISVMATVGVLAGTCAAAAAAAAAASVSAPLADCNTHNKLTQHYSTAELEHALNTMPADLSEYSDCAQVIQDQLLAQLGKRNTNGGAGAGSGGSFLPVPVIVAIVVLALAAVALGVLSVVRRKPRAP